MYGATGPLAGLTGEKQSAAVLHPSAALPLHRPRLLPLIGGVKKLLHRLKLVSA